MKVEKGISENQKRGSVGESLIEAKLKRFAHVACPANLLDYTIDFFCALYDGSKPSNTRFNIQAKTCKSIGEKWEEPIEREKIKFWLEQAFPVFVLLIDEETEDCYWLSVEDNRQNWLERLELGHKTLTISIDKNSRFNEQEFIKKVNSDTVRVKAHQGIPVFISKGYVGIIPYMKLSKVSRIHVNQTVRLGLDYLIYDRVLDNNLIEAHKICKILCTFDHSHYDHFLLMARICQQLGKTSEASKNYDKAIEICRRDKNWNLKKQTEDPKIEEIIEILIEEKQKMGELSKETYRQSLR